MNKLLNADTRITDRFIYNEASSIRNTLLKQEANKNRLSAFSSLFKTINKVELINVDTIEACGIDSDCVILRTKHKLPKMVESSNGDLIRTIASLDGTKTVFLTTDLSFARRLSINDKYAKNEALAFVRNRYMYFANITWPFAKIEAIFEDNDEIDNLNNCDDEEITCTPAYERTFPIPNYLEDGLKRLLNESLLRYYHQLHEDPRINKHEG